MDSLNLINDNCAYSLEGLEKVYICAISDYCDALILNGERNAYVDAVFVSGDGWREVSITKNSRYTSQIQNKLITHTLEAFIRESGLEPPESAEKQKSVNLAFKNGPFVVAFKALNGLWYMFGADNGAGLAFANQTTETPGTAITLTAQSIYPRWTLKKSPLEQDPQPTTVVAGPRTCVEGEKGISQAMWMYVVDACKGQEYPPGAPQIWVWDGLSSKGEEPPEGYEIVGYYGTEEPLFGIPTGEYLLGTCGEPFIELSIDTISVENDGKCPFFVDVECSDDWYVTASNGAEIFPTSGNRGITTVAFCTYHVGEILTFYGPGGVTRELRITS